MNKRTPVFDRNICLHKKWKDKKVYAPKFQKKISTIITFTIYIVVWKLTKVLKTNLL